MKKVTLGLFLVCLSIMLTFFSYGSVYALGTPNTIYPDNILEYVDLTNISAFDINDKYIAYTLDKSTVTLFCKENREYSIFSGFTNISKIKLTSNSLVIADQNSIKVIKEYNRNNIITLPEISLNNIKALDIYTDNSSILIGTIDSTTFKLYKYSLQFDTQINNPIHTITPSIINFDNAFMMAINNKTAYIVYKKLPAGEKYTTGLCKISLSTNTNNIQILDPFQANARVIDTFIYNDTEYITTFTNEILYLLSSENEILSNINISTTGDLSTNAFPIFEISDLQFFDNKIYISDVEYKTIQSVTITQNNDEYIMQSDSIIIGSSSFDYGRFNSISDIWVQGDVLITSDTNNNRLHILKSNESHFINIPTNATNPHNLAIDSNQNIYFSVLIDGKNHLLKYNYSNSAYTLSQDYSKYNNTDLGYISDICTTNSDTIFMVDSTNNNILYLSANNLIKLENTILKSLNFNTSSQIKYLKSQNLLVISTDNMVYIVSTDGQILDNISISNLKQIVVDSDKCYAITNSSIITLDISNDNTFNNSLTTSFNSTNYTKFTYDIIQRRLIAFDYKRSCLVSINFNEDTTPFNFSDISDTTPLQTNSTLIPLKITNALIYDYPYELGNIYNLDGSIDTGIAIEVYDKYYRIIFKENNELKCGFVRKSLVTKVNHTYNPIDVITTNQVISVYKYPTLLTYQGNRIVSNTLPIGKSITLTYEFPISLDGKVFYMYQVGNEIGFIFNADVVLSDNKTIKNLNTDNASIHLIGKETTILYDSDLTTPLKTLKENDRIYVEKYDKKENYTKVILKDSNLNTIEGYVLTQDITMDKLDNSKIILIIVIIASVVLLTLIIVSYIIIKKKNK